LSPKALILIGIISAGTFSLCSLIAICETYAQTINPPTTATKNFWSIGAKSEVPKMESAYTSIGDKIYIIAGYGETGKRNKNSVEIYDANSDSWDYKGVPPVPENLNHAAAATFKGKVYVVGGYLDDKIPSNKLFIYDSSNNQWHEGKNMPTARAALTAQFVDGILYAIGGTTDGPLTSNEAYDPTTDTWTEKAPMPTERQHMASSVVDGKIYVIGGRHTGKSSNIDNNEVFDPILNSWSSLAPMPTARGGIAAATVNSEIYVFGGESPNKTFDNVEKYNPKDNTWKVEEPMPTPRHGLAAVAIGNNIFVIGGGSEPDISFAKVNEIFHVVN
jgi:N-acetylneuraminic acid mutarotase